MRVAPTIVLAISSLGGVPGCHGGAWGGAGGRGGAAGAPLDSGAEAGDTRSGRGDVEDAAREAGVPRIVLEPDDEAFDEEAGKAQGVEADADAGGDGGGEAGRHVYTVKGILRKVDAPSGRVVVDQLLADGRKHEVVFFADSATVVGWSEASMKMTLGELPLGAALFVTYTVKGTGDGKQNQALKITRPGGMEDVAKLILGTPEGSQSGGDKGPKKRLKTISH